MTPLAHAGGVDEMLALVVPAVFIWAWHIGRREDAASREEHGVDAPVDHRADTGART